MMHSGMLVVFPLYRQPWAGGLANDLLCASSLQIPDLYRLFIL